MLLVSYLYDLSERQTEQAVNENIPMKFFYGYKAPMSLNAATGLIPSAAPTAGNVPDGKRLTDLVEKDLKQGLPVKAPTAARLGEAC